jgi:hypothetical protein
MENNEKTQKEGPTKKEAVSEHDFGCSQSGGNPGGFIPVPETKPIEKVE